MRLADISRSKRLYCAQTLVHDLGHYSRNMTRAFISGCSGPVLTAQEREFIRKFEPWGLILFARNCVDPDQIRALIAEFRECVGHATAPVLIDQEGGRVQRLKPPHWAQYPPGRKFGDAYATQPQLACDMAQLVGFCIGSDLYDLGINIDCAPVADVPVPGAHDVIGDRAFGTQPEQIAKLSSAMAEGLMRAGVCPVIKHIPGHGRAQSDSHKALPIVKAGKDDLATTDFAAFKVLANLPAAMTAHVIYEAYDKQYTATHSATIIQDVIRGEIGFDGLLMTDDLSMQALEGPFEERAQRAFEAGCDVVLHCNGNLVEMTSIAQECPTLAGEALRRAENALAALPTQPEIAKAELRAKLLKWAEESPIIR